jgi:hypothetical protein
MDAGPPSLDRVAAALRARGLAWRGSFHPSREDGVPPRADGRLPGTVVLAGDLGGSTWERFAAERQAEADPLDHWAARALAAVAAPFGAEVVLPGTGPPFAPFQRWALRAESLHVSPLGLLIHPEYGLWHAYRGALLIGERLALPPRVERPSPCTTCDTRPCLSSCPVGAFRPEPGGPAGFDAAACLAHVTAPSGRACRERGCLARRACPVGRERAYGDAQQRFHLDAFVAAHGRR